MDTSPRAASTAAPEPSGRHNRLPRRNRRRETGTPTGRRGTHAAHWMRLGKRQARPQAAGQALQRLLQGWLRSTLREGGRIQGKRPRGSRSFSTEWALQHKTHLLNRKAAENKTPLYKTENKGMYTWAHSNTLRLRNSPGKGVAQGSAARGKAEAPAQPGRGEGQAAQNAARRGPASTEVSCPDRAALRAPREAATGTEGLSTARLVRGPLLASGSGRCSFSYTDQGRPSRGAWLPGPSRAGGASCLACALPRGSAPAPSLLSACTGWFLV